MVHDKQLALTQAYRPKHHSQGVAAPAADKGPGRFLLVLASANRSGLRACQVPPSAAHGFHGRARGRVTGGD